MASSPRRWKWTESLHVVLRAGRGHAFEVSLSWTVVFGDRPRLRGSSNLSEEVRHSGGGEDGENAEWVVAADAKSVRAVCRNESGHALSQTVRLPVHVHRHLPAEDVEQFAGWVRVKIIFVARRSVNLSDSDGTARHGTVCDDTDDRPEEQEMFGRFFVEAVSFSFLFRHTSHRWGVVCVGS